MLAIAGSESRDRSAGRSLEVDTGGTGGPRPENVMATTEITLVGGDRLCVKGQLQQIEAQIVGAARGSIMELAWLVDAGSGDQIGINPEHVIMIRGCDSDVDRA